MAYNFDTIAARYDRMNHLMTLGLDRRWRKRAVQGLGGKVLDIACGTGDMTVALLRQGCSVTGIDLSHEMLAIARQKVAQMSPTPPPVTFLQGDAEALPFADGAFDAVTCAFGVRNFVHLQEGLSEMLRVVKTGGQLAILELSTPDSWLIRPFYRLYTQHIIPWLGSCLAGNRDAYTYLPDSIEHFAKGDDFLQLLPHDSHPVAECHWQQFTWGVCRLYRIKKM